MKTRSFWRKNFRELKYLQRPKLQLPENEADERFLKTLEMTPERLF